MVLFTSEIASRALSIILILFVSSDIKVHYRNRDNEPDALGQAIEYCKKQIAISNKSKIAFLKDKDFGFLPSHTGL